MNQKFYILKRRSWYFIEYILNIITVGIFYFIMNFFPELKMNLFYKKVLLSEAKYLKFEKTKDYLKIEKIIFANVLYYIYEFEKVTYHIEYTINGTDFKKVKTPFKNKNYIEIKNESSKLSSMNKDINKKLYGSSFLDLGNNNLFLIILNEFNCWIFYFQLFSVVIWFFDNYIEYASLILVLTTLSVVSSSYEQYKNVRNINRLANEVYQYEIKDINNNWITVSSYDIVVGDIIKIKENMKINNDIILTNGFCYTNESNLTGESKPILKKPFNSKDKLFNNKLNNNILLSGSIIISTDLSYCEGIVYKTGFSTIKGKIIKNILFQKNYNKSWINDSLKFLLLLLFINVLAIFYYIYKMIILENNDSAFFHFIKICEILTTMLPPGLPLFLNECIRLTKKKLEKNNITCINNTRINQCARINKICFDKTGTLTSDKLEISKIYFNDDNIMEFKEEENNSLKKQYKRMIINNSNNFEIITNFIINIGLNNCLFKKDNGEILGNVLDKTLFKLSKFNIQFNNPKVSEYDVKDIFNCIYFNKSIKKIKIFEFNSNIKRMGVIAKIEEKHVFFMKGAYEYIKPFLIKNSIPENWESQINKYSKEGYRLLVTCYKNINNDNIDNDRESHEVNLIFTGLIILRNKLKKETRNSIIKLKRNNIQPIMITGDNLYTSINIAIKSNFHNSKIFLLYKNKKSELKWKNFKDNKNKISLEDLSHGLKTNKNYKINLAVECNKLEELRSQLDKFSFTLIFKKIIIFSRASPFNKEQIVIKLKEINKGAYNIGFCGDGNNDCLALKESDVGLSLSTNESSLSSPFTYTKEEISGFIKLIIEGKNCYESSFQSFLFLIYSAFSQFSGLMILYLRRLDYRNFHYYYMDLFMTILISNAIVSIDSAKKLNKYIPNKSLFNKRIIISLIITMFINIIVFKIGDILVDNNNDDNLIRTFIFLIAITFVYIEGLSVVRIYPYRSKIKLKSEFLITILIPILFHIILVFQPFRDVNGNYFNKFIDKIFSYYEISYMPKYIFYYYTIIFFGILSILFVHKFWNKFYVN